MKRGINHIIELIYMTISTFMTDRRSEHYRRGKEAMVCTSTFDFKTTCVLCIASEAEADCCCQGEAEVHILNFQTTWSEFKKESQTATK